MRSSDVSTLDRLVADDLIFMMPDWSTIGKEADLKAHREGHVAFGRIAEVNRTSTEHAGCGVTVSVVDATIVDRGQNLTVQIRYERSWLIRDGRWQVTRVSATPVG